MKYRLKSVCTLATTLIVFGSLALGANAATLVTSSGSASTSDVSLTFDETFVITSAGNMNILRIGPFAEDSNRDAVQFAGANQLEVRVNSVLTATTFQDFNDGGGGVGPGSGIGLAYLDEYSWIFIEGAQNVVPGDTVRISGTASGGAFKFGNSANTFSLLPTGTYELGLFDVFTGTDLTAIPEPSSALLLGIGMLGIVIRRRNR
jgi:hypothetical protein